MKSLKQININLNLVQIWKRYRTLRSHKIYSLPVVILMPHSACNCRCIMCDIWKDNKNLKQLTEEDVRSLIDALKKYQTKRVVMSGGEALLNKNIFQLCQLLNTIGVKTTILSTGLTLERHAGDLLKYVDDVIVSLDGPAFIHNEIRRIPKAYEKLRDGVKYLKNINPDFKITARSVIQRQNFKHWMELIESAKEIGLDQISFLPADVTSEAFNRLEEWGDDHKDSVCPTKEELTLLKEVVQKITMDYEKDIQSGFIAESSEKLNKIYQYYGAHYGLNPYPYKTCNAPWVSTVIEADGSVRPCFFHSAMGNIHNNSLDVILNSEQFILFRKNLDMDKNEVCKKCVCYLNLKPTTVI